MSSYRSRDLARPPEERCNKRSPIVAAPRLYQGVGPCHRAPRFSAASLASDCSYPGQARALHPSEAYPRSGPGSEFSLRLLVAPPPRAFERSCRLSKGAPTPRRFFPSTIQRFAARQSRWAMEKAAPTHLGHRRKSSSPRSQAQCRKAKPCASFSKIREESHRHHITNSSSRESCRWHS